MKIRTLILITSISLVLCACDKKGALEDLADSVIDNKQGIKIEITTMPKEVKK